MSGRWPEEKKNPLAKVRGRLTIEQAAVAMGITGRTLSRYESGITDVPMKIVDKMVKLYQVPIETIYAALKEMWTISDGQSNENMGEDTHVACGQPISELIDESQFGREVMQAAVEYAAVEEAAQKLKMSRSNVHDYCQLGILVRACVSDGDYFIPIDELNKKHSELRNTLPRT